MSMSIAVLISSSDAMFRSLIACRREEPSGVGCRDGVSGDVTNGSIDTPVGWGVLLSLGWNVTGDGVKDNCFLDVVLLVVCETGDSEHFEGVLNRAILRLCFFFGVIDGDCILCRDFILEDGDGRYRLFGVTFLIGLFPGVVHL
jgi:hypothetical protein